MSLLPRLDGLPRAYWVLWTGMLINRLGGFVVPFLALYLTQERGLAIDHAGWIVSLYGVGGLLSAPIGGALADRLGRRATLLLGLSLGALAMLATGFARTPLEIALAVLLLSLLGDLARPANQAMVADLVPEADRPRAYGFLYWAINLGFAVAPVVAGYAAGRGFRWLFIGDAVTTLAFAALVLVALPETRPSLPRPPAMASLLAPYRDPRLVAFLALQLLVMFSFNQGFVALPIDLRAHGIAPSLFGRLIAINGLLIVLLQPFAVALVGRFDRDRVLALGALLVGCGFGLTALVDTPPGYALSIGLWTLGEIAIAPVASTVVADLAPPELRGSYQGAFNTVFGASACLAPALGTLLLARAGAPVLWGTCLAAGVAAALGQLLVGRAFRARRERRAGAA